MRNRINAILVVSVLVLISLGCDAFINIKGRIVDENDVPIVDAKIVTLDGDYVLSETTSMEGGTFDIFENIAPFGSHRISIRVSKNGFETVNRDFDYKDVRINQNTPDVIVKLKRQ